MIELQAAPAGTASTATSVVLTCRNGFRQVGAPRRVASLVHEVVDALATPGAPASFSGWRANPPWDPEWPSAAW
ncbi:hypothetical protein [Cellulomonas pakistanensis]|uniref:Uncharacterized protein n=1 Tax=Cellulomonas pakistanensis TaxID=992287 RepID=A0A919PAX7_9CELL|nr:hypothetical protein [Cellulomonas pakistanensis]GIG37650.1 hypothetical protein Cpa01nite_30310 [Cellulomonas pakistanensis]